MIKKVLVTGANGFIGSHIVEYYLNKGFNVYALDVFPIRNEHEKLTKFIVDLENQSMIETYKEIMPDIFIHCAGNANVGISIENPELDFNRNVGVLYKVLNDIRLSKINPVFIFLSSAAVYGNPKELPIKENNDINPVSPYGLHKKICEDICLYYSNNYNIDVKILRVFSAYGNGLKKQIIWDMGQKIIKNGKLELFGTGRESRDFIHIKDIVNSLNLIIESKNKNKIFNIANGVEITINQLAEIFIEKMGGLKEEIKFNGTIKKGDPINWRADITNLNILNYKQTVTIEDGISEYVEWLKNKEKEEYNGE